MYHTSMRYRRPSSAKVQATCMAMHDTTWYAEYCRCLAAPVKRMTGICRALWRKVLHIMAKLWNVSHHKHATKAHHTSLSAASVISVVPGPARPESPGLGPAWKGQARETYEAGPYTTAQDRLRPHRAWAGAHGHVDSVLGGSENMSEQN